MSVTLYVKPQEEGEAVLEMVKTAINGEIVRLEIALRQVEQRLARFETRYGRNSVDFAEQGVAEDLDGGDQEYVAWMGEYQQWLLLHNRVTQLRQIDYAPHDLS
jgi:hypothetical protein